jgi:hypothetical protein
MIKNWKITVPMILLTAFIGGTFLSEGAEVPQESDGEFRIVDSYSDVLSLKDSDVGKPFMGWFTIDDKDNAMRNAKNYLFTVRKEGIRSVSKELDLTAKTGNWQMAILVDDQAKLKITQQGAGAPPATTLPQCMGSAIWSDVAFHLLNYRFEGGKKYTIDFDYNNTCHRTLPGGMWDYDGVIAYVFPVRDTLDVDVDSNNDGIIDGIGDAEDNIEDMIGLPGKILRVNDEYSCKYTVESGRVPGWANGIDKEYPAKDGLAAVNNNTVDTIGEPPRFIPMLIKLPLNIPINDISLRFTYAESDPNDIERKPASLANPRTAVDRLYPYIVSYALPGNGSLRLWTKDGNCVRNAGYVDDSLQFKGDFITSGRDIPVASLGMNNAMRDVCILVEAVKPSATLGDLSVKVELKSKGAVIQEDQVRFTAVKLEFCEHPTKNKYGFDKTECGAIDVKSLLRKKQDPIIYAGRSSDAGGKYPQPDIADTEIPFVKSRQVCLAYDGTTSKNETYVEIKCSSLACDFCA